jgi:sigma-E factor negative regulatory protein RseC
MANMKTGTNDIISHEGTVQETVNGSVLVRITSVSACAGCHSEGSCGMAGKEEKLIKVNGYYDVSAGDNVTVIMKKSMGYRAVMLGYVLPFFTVIISLIVFNSLSFPELASGLLSMAVLIPYYTLLFLFKKRIDKEFTFTLKS